MSNCACSFIGTSTNFPNSLKRKQVEWLVLTVVLQHIFGKLFSNSFTSQVRSRYTSSFHSAQCHYEEDSIIDNLFPKSHQSLWRHLYHSLFYSGLVWWFCTAMSVWHWQSCFRLFPQSLNHSFVRSLTVSFVRSYARSLTHLFVRSYNFI